MVWEGSERDILVGVSGRNEKLVHGRKVNRMTLRILNDSYS